MSPLSHLSHLRQLREHRFSTQLLAARAAGIPPSTYSLIEAGRLMPTVEQLRKLAAAFDLPVLAIGDLCASRQEGKPARLLVQLGPAEMLTKDNATAQSLSPAVRYSTSSRFVQFDLALTGQFTPGVQYTLKREGLEGARRTFLNRQIFAVRSFDERADHRKPAGLILDAVLTGEGIRAFVSVWDDASLASAAGAARLHLSYYPGSALQSAPDQLEISSYVLHEAALLPPWVLAHHRQVYATAVSESVSTEELHRQFPHLRHKLGPPSP